MSANTPAAALVVVSKSEPEQHVPQLCARGINAVAGEAGSDYVWWPHSQQWAIERKTVSNLLGSLADRQLVEQTHRGAQQFDRFIILIEGDYGRSPNGKFHYYSPKDPRSDRLGWVESKWDYSSIVGMLFALQLVGDKQNVLVYHWPVLYDAPTAIASIVMATCAADAKFTRERQRPDLPSSAALGGKLYGDALWALMALPGCGATVAEVLLGHYGSLAAAVAGIAVDGKDGSLAAVKVNGKRIGDKRATILYTAVTSPFK